MLGCPSQVQGLPLPVHGSPASRDFVPLCLPTLTLHCVAPVFRLIKRIRNPGLKTELNNPVNFLAFVLAVGSLGPDRSSLPGASIPIVPLSQPCPVSLFFELRYVYVIYVRRNFPRFSP